MAATLESLSNVSAMKREKYTREVLADAVASNVSFAGVLRTLGLRLAGGTQAHITRKVRAFGIDTSHFTGQGTNRGPNHKGPAKTPANLILTKRETGRRALAVRLRRALLEIGRAYRCVSCGVGETWQGRTLILQVNHRNQDWLDDRPENLEFLCPNCHSQTVRWCGSKGGTEITSAAKRDRDRRVAKRQPRQA